MPGALFQRCSCAVAGPCRRVIPSASNLSVGDLHGGRVLVRGLKFSFCFRNDSFVRVPFFGILWPYYCQSMAPIAWGGVWCDHCPWWLGMLDASSMVCAIWFSSVSPVCVIVFMPILLGENEEGACSCFWGGGVGGSQRPNRKPPVSRNSASLGLVSKEV